MVNIQISDADIDTLIADHNATQEETSAHWSFDEQRRHVLKAWQDVQACPGSGKTTLVAAKLLILAKKWEDPHRGICVLTHTNVAKDEIVSKIQKHPLGYSLTSYPHFIGTFQEFINRFIALPYIREQFGFKRIVDGKEGEMEVRRANMPNHQIEQICKNLWGTCDKAGFEDIKNYLGSLHYINSDGDLRFIKQNNSPETIKSSSKSPRRLMLAELKEALCKAGIFQYRDMYAFSEKLLKENSGLIKSLQERFPVILIDEMQDTQKFQDDLINSIFINQGSLMQRFGDPDQAIYDGIGNEEANVSYNQSQELHDITTSHRFGDDICEKIIGLSYHNIDDLSSLRTPNRGPCTHNIIIYNDTTRPKVLEKFGELIQEENPESNWIELRALGGVDGENGHIKSYWEQYRKGKSNQLQKPERLEEAVLLCLKQKDGDVNTNYNLLVQSIVDLCRNQNLKIKNKNDEEVYYTKQSLLTDLHKNNKYDDFRKLLTTWILEPIEDDAAWLNQIKKLLTLLEIGVKDLTEEAKTYLTFSRAAIIDTASANTNNLYKCNNGREIKISTIHAAKGETHDATLVLETSYMRYSDLYCYLDYLIEPTKESYVDNPASPKSKNSILAKFQKKLYVACSRPRHLLCLAIHEDHISDQQKTALRDKGWNIHSVVAMDE